MAIGRRGQAAPLTSRLTGWEVNIAKDESASQAFELKINQAITTLAKALGVDEETARALARAGVNSVEGVLEVDPEDIAGILGVDVERALQIHQSARQEHDRNLASI